MTVKIEATQNAPAIKQALDARGHPVYAAEQIALYEAVLSHEDARIAARNGGKGKMATLMSGGNMGKSALLNRIASGLRPLVMAPPLSFSYPAYEMIEAEGPIETLVDEDLSLDDMLKFGTQAASFRKAKAPCVVINQCLWDVLGVSGKESALVTFGGWASLGFTWRLSKDLYPLSETQSRIISWHNSELNGTGIATLEQLKAEKRWHVMKMVGLWKTAADERLSMEALEEARKKDVFSQSQFDGGGDDKPTSAVVRTSCVYEYTAMRSRIEQAQKEMARRVNEGLSAFPDDAEIQRMVDDKVDSYVGKDRQGGTGYAVGKDGELVRKAWRLQRVAPAKLPETIYLDPSALLERHKARSTHAGQAVAEGTSHGNV